jgi:hypothetical protein
MISGQWLSERIGRLLGRLCRQTRARRNPAALKRPPRLLAFLDGADVGLRAGRL